MTNRIRYRSLLGRLAMALAVLGLPAALPGAAAAAPAPLDVGATRIGSAHYFQSYAGEFLVVKARDPGAASLTMSWFEEGDAVAAGSQQMSRRSDAGTYLYDSVLVPVAQRPDYVIVERDEDNYSRAPVTDWATGAAAHPPGYLSGFFGDYVSPVTAAQRLGNLAAEYPNLAETITLPEQTNGYQRRAQTIVGSSPTGGASAPSSGAAAAAVVLTSTAFGHQGGNDVTVALAAPGAANAPLVVSVTGGAITVNLASDASGAVTSTAAQVVAAINAAPAAAALATAATYRGNAGSGVVMPTTGTVPLSDGLAAPAGQPRGPQPVRALRIGKFRDSSKPGVLITAWTDGRDRVTPLVALELAERLLRNYGTDPATTALVDSLDVFVVPVANPDGAAFATYDNPSQAKNMTPYCPSSGAADPAARDLWGVNLGRNFSVGSLFDGYAGASSSCTDPEFAGPSELSEPESRNLRWLLSTFPNVKFAADLQASGGAVTWSPGAYRSPDRTTLPHPHFVERQLFAELAERIAAGTAGERETVLLPTEVGPATDVHGSAAGNFLDEAYYSHGVYALGIDVGADRMAPDGQRTPVGATPPFLTEGRDETMEFADGLQELLAAVRAWGQDTSPPDVTTDPPPTAFAEQLDVRLVSDEPATINYTLDGSTPTTASLEYRPSGPLDVVEPIRIDSPTTLKWIATDVRGNTSAVRSAEFRLLAPATLAAEPSLLAFGDVEVGATSGARAVTVRNEGEQPAALGELAVAGAARDAVVVAADTCSSTTLAPDASCTLSVRLAPAAAGALAATLSLPSDAPGGPLTVPIEGFGVTRPILRPLAPPPRIGPLLVDIRRSSRCTGPRRDVHLTYRLLAPAKLKLTLQRRVPPRRAPRLDVCPKPGSTGNGSPRFSDRIPFPPRARRVPTRRVTRTLTLAPGLHRLALLKTLGAQGLGPGGYRVVLQAEATDGSGSQTAIVHLRVLRPPRR